MTSQQVKKLLLWVTAGVLCLVIEAIAMAAASGAAGIGAVAGNVTGNLANIAKLITAGSYVAGFGFAVAGIAKFKAYKDNPTQVPISMPIALLLLVLP